MSKVTTFVGLDVHKKTISVAVAHCSGHELQEDSPDL